MTLYDIFEVLFDAKLLRQTTKMIILEGGRVNDIINYAKITVYMISVLVAV